MGKVDYLVCPLCNMNRPRHVNAKDENTPAYDNTFRFFTETEVIQVREGGGRGSGFKKLEGAGTSIGELRSEDPQLYSNLLSETRRLLKVLEGQT